MDRQGPYRSGLVFILLLTSFSLLSERESIAQKAWFNKNWPFRRPLWIEEEPRGAETVYVEFSHCGFSAPDGRDIVITAGPGQEVRSKVIAIGFDDSALVAFQRQRGVAEYYAYFGNKRAKKTIREWEPEGGLLLEVRAMGSGSADSLSGMFDLLAKSPRVLGRDFRLRPALAFNPYGPQERYIHLLSGSFRIPETGEYVFAVNSRDASFALVDGNLVASWPGRHDSDAYSAEEHSGRVLLKKGRHSLTLFNAAFDQGGCALGLKTPSSRGVRPFPPHFLFPIVEAKAGLIERIDRRDMADFVWRLEGDLGLEGLEATHLTFQNGSCLTNKKPTTCRWDFGDGQSAEGGMVEHVYLQSGVYSVTMTLDFNQGSGLSASRRIRVQPRGRVSREDRQIRGGYLDKLIGLCEGYRLDALSSEASSTLAGMAEYAGREDLKVSALEGVFNRGELLDGPWESSEAIEYGRGLLASSSQFEKAAHIFLDAARSGSNDSEQHAGYLFAAEVYLYYLEDPDAAEPLLFGAKKKRLRLDRPRDRWTAVRLGDLKLARGDAEGAIVQYDRVQKAPFKKQRLRDSAFSRGDFQTAFHSHLAAKELDRAEETLRAWELAMPALKSEGEITSAWAALMIARDQWRAAIQQLEWTLVLNPDSVLEPLVLLDLARCHEALEEREKARDLYRRIQTEYPLSSEAKTAKEKLEHGP